VIEATLATAADVGSDLAGKKIKWEPVIGVTGITWKITTDVTAAAIKTSIEKNSKS